MLVSSDTGSHWSALFSTLLTLQRQAAFHVNHACRCTLVVCLFFLLKCEIGDICLPHIPPSSDLPIHAHTALLAAWSASRLGFSAASMLLLPDTNTCMSVPLALQLTALLLPPPGQGGSLPHQLQAPLQPGYPAAAAGHILHVFDDCK